MYHEWECPDCGHELHHECEITEAETPQGDSEYCGDPDDPLCGPDLGKPWCGYHGGTEVPQRDSEIFRIDLGDAITRRATEAFTEAPFCLIDPDNRPSPFIRRTAEHDIIRVIADRLEQQRILEENEQADKRLRKAQNPRCEAECTEHPAHLWDGTPVPQGKPGGVPCLCQGLSHYEGCPNWELPH